MRSRCLVKIGLVATLALVPALTAHASTHPHEIEVTADLGLGFASAINGQGVVAGHTDGEPWTWRSGRRTPLATFDGPARPEAINTRGEVVGSAMAGGEWHGVLWTRRGIEILEGFTRANDINDRGEIVGVGQDGAVHLHRGRLTVLPDLGVGGEAHGINQRGLIAGSVVGPGGLHAAVWRDGQLEDLSPRLHQWTDISVAYDIGDGGHITGIAWGSQADRYGFVIDPDGTVRNLIGGFAVVPRAVDRHGHVVGEAADESGEGPSVWLPDGWSIRLVGALEDEYRESAGATDINGKGQIVGSVRSLDGSMRAGLWQLP